MQSSIENVLRKPSSITFMDYFEKKQLQINLHCENISWGKKIYIKVLYAYKTIFM